MSCLISRQHLLQANHTSPLQHPRKTQPHLSNITETWTWVFIPNSTTCCWEIIFGITSNLLCNCLLYIYETILQTLTFFFTSLHCSLTTSTREVTRISHDAKYVYVDDLTFLWPVHRVISSGKGAGGFRNGSAGSWRLEVHFGSTE